jgi:hypothetical protein
MGNLYCTPTEVKAYLGVVETTDDALILSLCERVSRMMDQLAATWFYERTETRTYAWQGYPELRLDAPLLSVTALVNDGTTWDSGDYILMPLNVYPKAWIESDKGEAQWFTWTDSPQDCTTVAGLWAWHDDPDNRWSNSGDTVQNDPLSASATTVSVTSASLFQVGQQIRLGATEQAYITATQTVAEADDTLTVERGQNGTTAAVHVKTTAIYIYRPVLVVREMARQLTSQIYRMRDSLPWGRIEYVDIGTIQMISGVPEMVHKFTSYFRGIRV